MTAVCGIWMSNWFLFVMVLLTGFMDLSRIYFCRHSNQRKTNWTWFCFNTTLLFWNKTLNSLLWSLSALISILSISKFFDTGQQAHDHLPLDEGGAVLWAAEAMNTPVDGVLIKQGGCLESMRMASKLGVSQSCNSYIMLPEKNTGSDNSPWKVIC